MLVRQRQNPTNLLNNGICRTEKHSFASGKAGIPLLRHHKNMIIRHLRAIRTSLPLPRNDGCRTSGRCVTNGFRMSAIPRGSLTHNHEQAMRHHTYFHYKPSTLPPYTINVPIMPYQCFHYMPYIFPLYTIHTTSRRHTNRFPVL